MINFTVKPSQWLNAGFFIGGIVGFVWVLPPVLALAKFLELYCWSYEFYFDGEPCIIEKKGVFTVMKKELLIYRIKSIRQESPLLMRLLGLSNLYILSSDPYQRELKLYAIKNSDKIWELLRNKNKIERKRNGLKEHDLFKL